VSYQQTRYVLINRNIRGNTLVPYSTDHPPRRTKTQDSKTIKTGWWVVGSLRACKRSILGHNDVKGLSDSLTVRRFKRRGEGCRTCCCIVLAYQWLQKGLWTRVAELYATSCLTVWHVAFHHQRHRIIVIVFVSTAPTSAHACACTHA